ncbi:DUF3857 and transglutaminase domain-containing protein [Cecembia sp.]|uniref:DUF3857 and transglutaminase domain-containing protein n=1 Tax=Cecembia sp. TaxID=1898110 RepID=UPI0025C2F856|nr:DUF3857 and transglutaminase domain-containing protein [Cecembia sp.]
MNKKFFAKTMFLALTGFFFSLHLKATVPYFSILSHHTEIILQDDYTVTYKVKKSTLILDKKGLGHGNILIPYSEIHRIMAFEGRLIDPSKGRVVKKISAKELSDYNNISKDALFDDQRVKFYGMGEEKLPMIVEVEYEVKQSGNFYFNSWYPLWYYNQKVEEATLEIRYPQALGLRYRKYHFDLAPDSSQFGDEISLSWKMKGLNPLAKEQENQAMYLKILPKKFSLEGFEADMSDWKNFGLWFAKLMVGKGEVTASLKEDIHRQVRGLERDTQKIEALYRYLQENYRYVYIGLGIDGWMPQNAAQVHQLKYGECKGLTNLMRSMLKEVGIDSQYTLVNAGVNEEDIDIEWSSNQFNHAILRVPLEDQTIWLECTSKTNPVGFLGEFTKNRHVLVITEDGGIIDKTPDYQEPAFNTFLTKNVIELKEDGNAHIEGEYIFKGNPSNNFLGLRTTMNGKDQKSFLNRNLGGSGLLIFDFYLEHHVENFVPTAKINFTGDLQKFAQNTSKRVLIPLNWKKISKEDLMNGKLYVHDIYEIHVSDKLEPENKLPQITDLNEEYSLKINTSWKEGVIRVEKHLETHFTCSETGNDLTALWQKVNVASIPSIVFKKIE